MYNISRISVGYIGVVMSNILVAYFSRAGEQYGVGEISKGNTAIIAEIFAKHTGADIFEIKVVNDDYPTKYDSLIERAKSEKNAKIRPELEGNIEDFDKYDTIFLGYPNWWGDMPMPVYSFIEKYDLSSKKVYHFCTHEGSGTVKAGSFELHGHIAQKDRNQAENKVLAWLKALR